MESTNKKPNITVTSPLLPDLNEFEVLLEKIWESKWITNAGQFHEQLERELARYLGVEYLSLFTNGTLPLITALQALGVRDGEVITTPFSFVATTHAIWWNGLTPVFVDIDPISCNIDPACIEEAITPRTKAIIPVHVYGIPCDTAAIDDIAKRHGLKVIYDAAHAFGVKVNGRSILEAGDISTLSFHATKVYNTIEGGAIVCHSREMKKKIDYLKNFGFEDEVTVVGPGINGKMDEMRSAYGLLNLRQVDNAIELRHNIALKYRKELGCLKGIRMIDDVIGVKHNYSYFPIFVDTDKLGCSRDELYFAMKKKGVFGRRYFYPLISSFETYSALSSSSPSNLPVATKIAKQVICLPMHPYLTDKEIVAIIDCIKGSVGKSTF